MAKVRHLPSNKTLRSNDAFSDLVSLELRDESPPRYDFNIDQFLNDNKLNLDKPSSDLTDSDCSFNFTNTAVSGCHLLRNLSGCKIDNDSGVLELLLEADVLKDDSRNLCLKPVSDALAQCEMAPNSKGISAGNDVTLSSLAEHYLKFDHKPQLLKKSSVDSSTTLADLLPDICENTQVASCARDLNAFGAQFSACNYGILKGPSVPEERSDDGDELALLLESSETSVTQSNNVSLSDLANTHFLSNLPMGIDNNLEENLENDVIYGCVETDAINFGLPGSFNSIVSSQKLNTNAEEELSLADLLKDEIFVENCASEVKLSPFMDNSDDIMLETECNSCILNNIMGLKNPVGNVTGIANKKVQILPHFDSSDDENVPDIDLSFCVKKPNSTIENSTLPSTSLDSTDSGFDETDFPPLKRVSNFRDFVSAESVHSPVKNLLINPTESLLSKVISCKHKCNKTKSEKLKKIKKDLFVKHFPSSFTDCNQQQHAAVYEKVVDHSNQCVIPINTRFNVPDL